ncbi:radical SAM protein [Actinoalloteichus sp. AHMU CJ021]|nr:radical SAM protein [Actinoalloteichus sp. AHMU CJ021]
MEITGKCQLRCSHCYAESGPRGNDGTMAPQDWESVIDQGARLGVEMVQFIGGEPTLHRSLPDFVNHALTRGLRVEVFSNLVHVSPRLWDVCSQPGVRLATSYYSDRPDEHERITKGRGSYIRVKTNIIEALRRSIPLRVGVIDLGDGQRVEQARNELAALGFDGEVRVDRLRGIGRGVRAAAPDMTQLCGGCGNGKVAVTADGTVWPCVFSRWLPVGNVRVAPLATSSKPPARWWRSTRSRARSPSSWRNACPASKERSSRSRCRPSLRCWTTCDATPPKSRAPGSRSSSTRRTPRSPATPPVTCARCCGGSRSTPTTTVARPAHPRRGSTRTTSRPNRGQAQTAHRRTREEPAPVVLRVHRHSEGQDP